jgi:hypothetical protein
MRAFRENTIAASVAGAVLLSLPVVQASAADWVAPTVTIGAGLRTSFTSTNSDGPGETVNDFSLDSARLYVNGKVSDKISFMFNTEYDGSEIFVLDAAAMFSFSDQFNIWAGRFIAPSDRANLYGPYYASDWAVYQDGVQDGYPFSAGGRDEGVMYWGQFGGLKVSAGAFDVKGLTTGSSDILAAGRLQYDFWDAENGYYLNGTYYGAKDLLAIGLAGETVDGDSAFTADVLMEKKLGGGGVITLEAEYAKYDGLGGYPLPASDSDGYYVLAGYLFPAQMGIGKFQILGKYGETDYTLTGPDDTLKTTEIDLNYVIKEFNARMSLYYLDKSYDRATIGGSVIGLGLQIQM